MKWEPWVLYHQDAEVLNIHEPPCKHCFWWKPHRRYDKYGAFSGIVCCTNPSKEIEKDFSCYGAKIYLSK